MKRGCFFTFLTILTISLGVVFYISKNHVTTVDKLIKPWVINKAKEELSKSISAIKPSPEKDSLKIIVEKYLKTLEDDKDFKIKENEKFFEELHFAVRDTELDRREISRLRDLFIKHLASINERQKKNPD